MIDRATWNKHVVIHHNLDPNAFVWLWMKYVREANDSQHCTNVLRGRYSKKLSKHNAALGRSESIVCDEYPSTTYKALYLCGVAKRGYSQKKNYPHNLHLPIEPAPGKSSEMRFENWVFRLENGLVLPIAAESALAHRYRTLPPEYTSCRIFRWAVGYFCTSES